MNIAQLRGQFRRFVHCRIPRAGRAAGPKGDGGCTGPGRGVFVGAELQVGAAGLAGNIAERAAAPIKRLGPAAAPGRIAGVEDPFAAAVFYTVAAGGRQIAVQGIVQAHDQQRTAGGQPADCVHVALSPEVAHQHHPAAGRGMALQRRDGVQEFGLPGGGGATAPVGEGVGDGPRQLLRAPPAGKRRRDFAARRRKHEAGDPVAGRGGGPGDHHRNPGGGHRLECARGRKVHAGAQVHAHHRGALALLLVELGVGPAGAGRGLPVHVPGIVTGLPGAHFVELHAAGAQRRQPCRTGACVAAKMNQRAERRVPQRQQFRQPDPGEAAAGRLLARRFSHGNASLAQMRCSASDRAAPYRPLPVTAPLRSRAGGRSPPPGCAPRPRPRR